MKNLKEVLRIARNNVDPKDFKVDPYIKKLMEMIFIVFQTK